MYILAMSCYHISICKCYHIQHLLTYTYSRKQHLGVIQVYPILRYAKLTCMIPNSKSTKFECKIRNLYNSASKSTKKSSGKSTISG